MTKDFVFLPWSRSPLVARALAPSSSGERRRVSLGIQVSANGTDRGPATVSQLDLYGAGDVARIDPAMVTRVEPQPGSRGMEPNYFPHVEFADADFPWRYSLDVAASPRVLPWILLIALRADEFRFLPPAPGSLPAIEVALPAHSLPDPAGAWAWAHMQVDLPGGDGSPSAVRTAVGSNPTGHFSRLLCPRKLDENTTYDLFVVPVFEAGRLRGLADPAKPNPWNDLAWTTGQRTPRVLPFYLHWQFATSASEDFESLVRRLSPIDFDQLGVGSGERVRGGETGYYPNYLEADATFVAEGALRTAAAVSAPFAEDGLTRRLATTLTAEIAGSAANDSATAEDPLLGPPAYGRNFRNSIAVTAPTTTGPTPADVWLGETNLDRRYRLAAGTGARVVRRNQDRFMRWCWEQAGDIANANRRLLQARAARSINERLVQRHVDKLPPEALLQLASMQTALMRAASGKATIAMELEEGGTPGGAFTIEERLIASKRPAAIAASRFTTRGRASVRTVTPTVTPGDASQPLSVESLTQLESERPARAKPWRAAVLGAAAPAVAAAATGSMQAPPAETFVVQNVATVALRAQMIAEVRAATELLVLRTIEGTKVPGIDTLDPILFGPRIPEPTYRYLQEEDARMLLPGVGAVPDESVGVLVENPRFIEAFLLGMNDEMNRELLWREFPSDLRTTVFPRFWERGAAPADLAADDIKGIDQWQGRLGTHGKTKAGDNVVLLLRGQLARRYPGFMLALNRQRVVRGQWKPGTGTDLTPRFWGALGPETVFFGFDLPAADLLAAQSEFFFVIYEPPGRYRFGLDVATYQVRTARRDLRHVAVPFPVGEGRKIAAVELQTTSPAKAPTRLDEWSNLSWSHVPLTPARYIDAAVELHPSGADGGQWGAARNSATLASVTFQRPVRMVIPARRMIHAT